MNKTIFITVFILLGSYCCLAQKIIDKEFSTEGIHKLAIIDDSVFRIRILSSKREFIKMKVYVSGENSETVIIEENLSKATLSLKTALTPYFAFEKR